MKVAALQYYCDTYGFQVLGIVSGMAYIRNDAGDEVLITVPRGKDIDWGVLYSQVAGRSLREGRFGQHAPDIFQLLELATPDTLMTWEEYYAKFDGRDKRPISS